ncbi:MAG: NHL domain-containing protein [Planctomycetota bacterium]|jgi:hypothetical protein
MQNSSAASHRSLPWSNLVLLAAALLCSSFTKISAQESESIPKFIITTVAGTGERGFSGDGGPATEARIERPTAVALDSKGNLYIAGEQNHRVRMVNSKGIIRTVVGTGKTKTQYDDLPATDTNLSNAYGIAVDYEDNLYVLCRGFSKILMVGEDGIATHIIGNGERGFAGDDDLAIEARINYSNHLVADAEGNLYIADTGNQRVRMVSPEGIITTIAGTGTRGFSGDGGLATKAELGVPSAIAIDRQGNLYIADFGNHRIRKVSTEGVITTIAGNGNPEYIGDGRPATECQFGEPCGVAVDDEGYVYIADQINSRVHVVTPSGMFHTVAGTGVPGRSGDGGPAEDAQISNPDIIAFDRDGNLYLPDHINAVVRKMTRVKG